jgi:hypothetical protein
MMIITRTERNDNMKTGRLAKHEGNEKSKLSESYVVNLCLSSPLFYNQVEAVKARAYPILVLAQVLVVKH